MILKQTKNKKIKKDENFQLKQFSKLFVRPKQSFGLGRKFSSLQTTNYKLQTSFGFTLVETMVAITILLLSIVGPMTLSQQGLKSARLSKNQITAFYLAQDTIEFIKNKITSRILKGTPGAFIPSSGLNQCLSNSCKIDTSGGTTEISNCGGVICPLLRKSSEGLYGYTSSWGESSFRRIVDINNSLSNSDEWVIEVKVEWDEGARNIVIRDSIFDMR